MPVYSLRFLWSINNELLELLFGFWGQLREMHSTVNADISFGQLSPRQVRSWCGIQIVLQDIAEVQDLKNYNN